MLVEALGSAFATAMLFACLLLLFLNGAEDLNTRHAIILDVIQPHPATVWVARELHDCFVWISFYYDAVNNVVTSNVCDARVLLEHLDICSEMAKPFMYCLVDTYETHLRCRQRLDKGSAIYLVTPIGIRSWRIVADGGLTD